MNLQNWLAAKKSSDASNAAPAQVIAQLLATAIITGPEL